MRTIGPASMSTHAASGSSVARIFAGLLVLGLVALLGVVAGVIVTRRSQHAALVAGSPTNGANGANGANGGAPPAALTGVAVNAAGDSVPAAASVAAPVVLEPTTPPTGTNDTAAGTASRATAARDAGVAAPAASVRRSGGKPAVRPGPKQPGDGDEYGF
jgi:hypothetical protein